MTFTSDIAKIRGIDAVLGAGSPDRRAWRPRSKSANNAVIAGADNRDPSSVGPPEVIVTADGTRLAVETNFLPMSNLVVTGSHAFSVALDDLGIHYDATRPSRLERLINGDEVRPLPAPPKQPDPVVDIDDPKVLRRAAECIRNFVDCELAWVAATPSPEPPGRPGKPSVLVVDQARGDQHVSLGLADAGRFQRMLTAARKENPDADILIARHRCGGERTSRPGHLSDLDLDEHTHRVAGNVDAAQLIARVTRVYVVTSPLGFIALMQAKPVVCFGAPFYAGWGITDDRGEIPARRVRRRSLAQVFAAAFFAYTRYIDPDLFEACSAERIAAHLQLQSTWRRRNAATLLGYGITWWKRHYVRPFVASNSAEVRFFQTAARIPRGLDPDTTAVFVWGYRDDRKLRRTAERLAYPVWRMEDGFLRSVGLGTDLTAPASLVLDTRGIYYDARQPSDLEHILAHDVFDDDLVARARRLITALVETGVSKYNVGHAVAAWRPNGAPGQTTILVPGQVEGDASLRYGGQTIRSNASLLAAVRRDNPHAFIVYKPHPDVVSGNRSNDDEQVDVNDFDALVKDISISACLDAVDEVHTMTSLTGFEALLRGKSVTTYGMPFYAGWGLTKDHCRCPRRTRRLTLDQLVAGTLILYPRYVNPLTGHFTTPEMVVELLRRSRLGNPPTPSRRGLLWRALRTVNAFGAGVLRELRHGAPSSSRWRRGRAFFTTGAPYR